MSGMLQLRNLKKSYRAIYRSFYSLSQKPFFRHDYEV